MADEAELRIKPVLAGSIRPELKGMERDMGGFHREQQRAHRQGRTGARMLERAYDGVRSTVRGVGGTLGTMFNRLTSIQTLVAGGLAYGAGRTFLERTVGQADEVALLDDRLKGMLGTTEEVADVHEQVGQITEDIPTMSETDALRGMEEYLGITEQNVGMSEELVGMTEAIAGLDPDRDFAGIQEQMRQFLQTGEPGEIEDFIGEVPGRTEAEKQAKKHGQTLERYYVDNIRQGLARRFNQDEGEVVAWMNERRLQTIGGQIQAIGSAIDDTFKDIGEDARGPVLDDLSTVAESWREMSESREFQRSIESLSSFVADSATALTGELPGLIDQIPGAMESVMDGFGAAGDFYDKHPTLVKVLAGAAAGNWLTGGALSQGLGSLVGSAVGRRMAGGGGGGGLGGGCCCCGGMGGKGGRGRGGGKAGWGTRALQAAGGGTGAGGGTVGAGAANVAAMAAPFAVGGFGLQQWASAMGDPEDVSGDPEDHDMDLGAEITSRLKQGDVGGIISQIGDPGEEFTGEGEQAYMLEEIDEQLSRYGLEANLEEGQRIGDVEFGERGMGLHSLPGMGSDPEELGFDSREQAAEALNQGGDRYDMTVNVEGGDPEQVRRTIEQMFRDMQRRSQ